jgi:hypothetical protein
MNSSKKQISGKSLDEYNELSIMYEKAYDRIQSGGAGMG